MALRVLFSLLAALHAAAAVQWTPIGCYTDSSTSRTLMAASLVSADNMTVESCLAFCTSGGYSLGGLEFGTQCYCDYALQSSGAPTTPASCTTPCSGNATEQCGGPNAINVYSNGSPSPVAPAQVGSWQYQGCFADSVSSRALPHQMFISGVTIESCTAACKANGFAVAGLEYAGECFCSSSPPTSTHLNDNDCHTACTANTTEFCGGSSKLTVYQDTTGEICIAKTLGAGFNLQAVYMTPPTSGPPSVSVHVNLINTVTLVSWSILTTANGLFTSIILTNGGLLPMSTSQPNFRTSSLAIVPGDSPTFVTTQFPPTPFPDYCIMSNPVNGSRGANTLALNNRNDLFALCPNSTAGNRQDVVFSPIANHPHYTLSSCQSVYIVLTS